MGKQYGHFTLEERCTIAQLQQAGQSIRQIATALDRSPSSVSRELKRNQGARLATSRPMPKSRPVPAAGRARAWIAIQAARLVLDGLRARLVARADRRLARAQKADRRQHETIYRFIYAQIRRTNDGAWRNYLPRAKYKRGWRASEAAPPPASSKPCSHRSAPRAVDSAAPTAIGKADLMLFAAPGQAILVAHERKSRLLLLPSNLASCPSHR
jgi:IS30 family transposase